MRLELGHTMHVVLLEALPDVSPAVMRSLVVPLPRLGHGSARVVQDLSRLADNGLRLPSFLLAAIVDLTDLDFEAILTHRLDAFLERRLLHVFESGVFFELIDEEVDALWAVDLIVEYVRLKRNGAPVARSVRASTGAGALRRRTDHDFGQFLQLLQPQDSNLIVLSGGQDHANRLCLRGWQLNLPTHLKARRNLRLAFPIHVQRLTHARWRHLQARFFLRNPARRGGLLRRDHLA